MYEQKCKELSQAEMDKLLLTVDLKKPLKDMMDMYNELEEKFGHKDDLIEF